MGNENGDCALPVDGLGERVGVKRSLSWPCVRDRLQDICVPALLRLYGQIHKVPAVCCPVSVSFVWVGLVDLFP